MHFARADMILCIPVNKEKEKGDGHSTARFRQVVLVMNIYVQKICSFRERKPWNAVCCKGLTRSLNGKKTEAINDRIQKDLEAISKEFGMTFVMSVTSQYIYVKHRREKNIIFYHYSPFHNFDSVLISSTHYVFVSSFSHFSHDLCCIDKK
ncbi:Hypothetical predicted protein [Octopus vulgaris]|uniref:Uncharacterized protein n=1 Tax=Octopus vulgaris TaxID=6645 RepID=A0AA36BBU5_OCTVU|nr:Hypothetical predicted protein [Octopus vulgaris]